MGMKEDSRLVLFLCAWGSVGTSLATKGMENGVGWESTGKFLGREERSLGKPKIPSWQGEKHYLLCLNWA